MSFVCCVVQQNDNLNLTFAVKIVFCALKLYIADNLGFLENGARTNVKVEGRGRHTSGVKRWKFLLWCPCTYFSYRSTISRFG